jgi:N-hydroxyarylamine O-acetyltransferase
VFALPDYLQRIGYSGPVHADLATFKSIHRAHVQTLSYENLDVQFGIPLTRDPAAIFDKIVRRRRGGWCYELNGLLADALESIGFEVRRLAGAVRRDLVGDAIVGNHLVLLVNIDEQQWIGDAGFGNGMIEPAPLRAGPLRSNPLQCHLQQVDGGWWRYREDPRVRGPNFDFHPQVIDTGLLDAQCLRLQHDPASPFVQTAVVQRWRGDVHWSLRGRVLRVLSAQDEQVSLVESAADYLMLLKSAFDLDVPEAAQLWPTICRQHEQHFANGAS